MKTSFLFLSILAVASVSSLNLNEMCQGLLFQSLPHPTDSNLFIGCVQGRGTLLGCGQDEVFNPFLVSCTTDDTPTAPEFEETCRNVTFGLFPYVADCTAYVVCEFSRPNFRQCPVNNVFNPYLPGCVPGNTETCEFYHHTSPPPQTERTTEKLTTIEETTEAETTEDDTEAPSTTTTRTTTPRGDGGVNISFNCPISGNGYIPHPSDCSRFFECVRGIRFPQTCPADKIFDVITKACNDPDVSLCAVGITCV